MKQKGTPNKKWYDYLWIVSLTYLILGFLNILFAWLGLLCLVSIVFLSATPVHSKNFVLPPMQSISLPQ